MDALEPTPINPVELEMMSYNGVILLIAITALIFTIVFSLKNGGMRELGENLLLWFLLSFGFINISSYPVDADDELTAGVFFLAFGLCRIAKHVARQKPY